jgi:hypothetical protein
MRNSSVRTTGRTIIHHRRAKFTNRHSEQGRGRGLDESGARLTLRRHLVASRREVWAQDELAVETARLETAVCLGDLEQCRGTT